MPKTFAVKLEQDFQEPLEQIAKQSGFVWGNRGNITAFLRALASGEIRVGNQPLTLILGEQQGLLKSIRYLFAQGDWISARSLARLFHSETTDPIIKAQLELILEPIHASSIKTIEECIQDLQPFQLSYQDAANRQWTFTVRYAELAFREKRNYLECWCEETEGNQDLPELRHNWSLRLDRIIDAGIVPVDGKWRSGLDTIEVEFQLFGGLAHAYQQRAADVAVDWISAEPPIKQVVRHISNTFWFIREVLPYGKDCLVLAPDTVRSRIVEQFTDALSRY